MKLIKLLLALGITLFSPVSLSAGPVKVITFSGPDDMNHANIVQIEIEGGLANEILAEGCNTRFAAIRNTLERQHMISYVLAAYATKESVQLVLNPSDKYFQDRCTISRISSTN
ncbi:hypothetical protein [Vibrio sp. St2]|uniref:hypothetical protein n=1 Tax=Vibrio sp. St2 TaxID=2853441 RepID=UPI00248F3875|nr:hypothetical protein [Vibrio sp. St2]